MTSSRPAVVGFSVDIGASRARPKGILARLSAQPPSLRLGAPGAETHYWERLEKALADLDRGNG